MLILISVGVNTSKSTHIVHSFFAEIVLHMASCFEGWRRLIWAHHVTRIVGHHVEPHEETADVA